ncbi:MAG TPA: lipoprotein-releasing ABC transporter permease subunit [Thermodesulfovibrio thiophilus]|uniref:lipoprotein-releasing ABC transporter permease subunit n=1 Tax=Thermodesulfovibrio thiophilus TaxID=340095 RepID=UPI000425A433|nr:lipoprotein-releasing ABC transporter permease subunit [Thermodesulfovibrio thiophilus]HHW19937.1 lipoprotein-releasing ABC transporter permease subunit [Thermodesulfovibrio thiophilus]HOA83433.1 lipoprotein-releasing ABC transporter permease subunit [Thermodesulfovibrio thiophilus]HQA04202.1 lipoprotein-releasing ABC transporter permease subunit [Thermodesulfovibrio thiophilus]HQD36711.1 lipoprotein-releasing ABC transporter permease subunit [Thermodesulfovibrio thiophilus]
MRLPFFIALRYLKSRKKGLSFGTVISISGVALGVMALIVVISVVSGFHEDLQKKILGTQAHAVVLSYSGGISDYRSLMELLSNKDEIKAYSPFVMGQVLVSSGKRAHGLYIRGIIPEYDRQTTEIFQHIKYKHQNYTDLPWIIIGKELANLLGVLPGDTVTVISPMGTIGPLGVIPKVKKFIVTGIFEIGMFEYDTNLAITDLKTAQTFFDYGDKVTGIQLKLKDVYRADKISQTLTKQLGDSFYVKDWMQMNRNLFSALKLEKFAMFVILILIVLVASFNIISMLMVNVTEKQRDIAILKSMGATDNLIKLIFMSQGLIIGLIGTLFGLAGGLALCEIIKSYDIVKLPADVYYLSKLPVKVKILDVALISASALLISLISTIYPAHRASKLNPVEILRYE